MSTKVRFWLIGIFLAAVGVVLARLISPMPDKPLLQLAFYFVGIFLALAGLAVITFGIRR